MNFKNKVIITFFVLLCFILFFNINNVFATVDFSHNGEDISLPDFEDKENSLYIIYYCNDTYYVLVLKNGITYINNGYKVNINASGLHHFQLFKYENDNLITQNFFNSSDSNLGIFVRRYNTTTLTWEKFTGAYVDIQNFLKETALYTSNENYVYSNFDVYNTDRSTILFQQPVAEIPATTIPALETAEQIPEAIMKMLTILIPVGLVLLSIGLVIYLIKRVKYSIM